VPHSEVAPKKVTVDCAKFSVAYAVTSDGRDAYADMALVSMLSVRLTNPHLRILAVCDEASAQALRHHRHRMLEVCDEVVDVVTGDGHPTFRNRLLKTQLCLHVPGPCLYLDADILVRGSLAQLPSHTTDIGAVANNNARSKDEMVWIGDEDFLRTMGWPPKFDTFVNGGVQFYHDTQGTRDFYELWHKLYVEGLERHADRQDQPSLNAAIKLSGVRCAVLPDIYNLQMKPGARGACGAAVWHFWHALGLGDSSFARLVAAAPRVDLAKLRRMVGKAIRQPYPYPNQDVFGRRVGRKLENNEEVSTFERTWLTDRKAALRFWAGGVRAKFAPRSGA
jgi:hypothetical protein